jgi:hypothetical protein
MDWLEKFNPMICDWLGKWMEFQHNNVTIKLQGILPSQDQEIKEVSMEQVLKWDKGNNLWATILLEPKSQPSALFD